MSEKDINEKDILSEEDILDILLKNGGKNGRSACDVKIQYNKNDVTAVFRKSFYNKTGVEKIANYHFKNVEQVKKALAAISEKIGVEITLGE